jgi:energy-coupling factor transporter ATP-binding protein EcfA2
VHVCDAVQILMRTLIVVPRSAGGIIEADVSLKRLRRFINLPERPNTLQRLPVDATNDAVAIERCSFSWGGPSGDAVLHDVELTVPRGSLTAVTGAIASGKSSLIAAILGELSVVADRLDVVGDSAHAGGDAGAGDAALSSDAEDASAFAMGVVRSPAKNKRSPSGRSTASPSAVAPDVLPVPRNVLEAYASRWCVKVAGKVAFVPQKPWILNCSLQDNVLFGEPLDEAKLNTVLTACCLMEDIAGFSDGWSCFILLLSGLCAVVGLNPAVRLFLSRLPSM